MKAKISTDLKQSKKLTEILPIDTADMFWLITNQAHLHILDDEPLSNYDRWEHYPAWSLSALLNYLRGIDFFPEIATDDISITAGITYIDWKDGAVIHDVKQHTEEDNDLIDVIVKLIIWMSENNFLNN